MNQKTESKKIQEKKQQRKNKKICEIYVKIYESMRILCKNR